MTDTPTLDREAIADLCRRHGVRRLSLFGSAASGGWRPGSSDVDFLVEFLADSTSLFDSYFDLKDDLESLLGSPVDLVMPRALENPYFADSVGATSQVVYAA